MKDIFKYPNESSTQFIDPNFIGDDTEGFQKRIKDLIDGTYKTHLNSTSKGSVSDTMNFIGRFNNATELEEDSGNNTIYKFWEQPLVEFLMQARDPMIKDVSVEVITHTHSGTDTLVPKLKIEFQKGHGLTSGDAIKVSSGNTTSGWASFTASSNNLFAQVINDTEIHLSTIATPTFTPATISNFVLPELNDTIYDITEITGQVIRRDTSAGAGTVLKTSLSQGGVALATGSTIKLKTAFTETDAGTANSTSTTFHTKAVSGTNYQYELYTDSGLSTPATLTETLVATGNRNYTSAGTVTLAGLPGNSFSVFNLMSDWGITGSDRTALEAFGTSGGWCRIKATVNSGTFTGKSLSDKAITTSIDYTEDFFFKTVASSASTFEIYNKRSLDGSQIIQDFILADAGSGVDVDIQIQFINPALTTTGYYKTLSDNTTDANTKIIKAADTEGKFEVASANIFNPGNKTYFSQTGASSQTAKASYSGVYYEAGDTSSTAVSTGSETMPPDSTITVNSSGFITGFSFADSVSGGIFNNNNTKYFPIMQGTDTYSAPAVSTAAQEDVFDLDTEWDTNAFSTLKTWPDTVLPSSIQMKYNQPSQTTLSQNGVKYVRNLGFTKWQMEVTYPPMSESQFRLYHSAAQKAKGQFVPFQFDIIKSNNTFFLDYHDANTTTNVRLKDDSTASNNVVLLEGFANNETINEGEIMIMGSNINGNIHTITNSGLSNIYGEFKARLAYPIGTAMTASQEAFLKPEHFVVTLGEDGFEYAKDTNGFYYVKLKLDLDEYKG